MTFIYIGMFIVLVVAAVGFTAYSRWSESRK